MSRKPRKNPLKEIEARLAASDVLTEEEKKNLLAKAKAQVFAKKKKEAEDEFLDAAVEEELRRDRPDEQFVDIMLDLPIFAAMIRLDNVLYFHGVNYSVPLSVAQTMLEIQDRAWRQENETRRGDTGPRRTRDITLTPSMQNVPASNITDLNQLHSSLQRV